MAGLSMDVLAQRAGVGKATIYRRWDSKETLILDALRMTTTPIPTPDEGSLRDDLFAYMDAVIECFSPGAAAPDVLPHLIEASCYDPQLRASLDDYTLEPPGDDPRCCCGAASSGASCRRRRRRPARRRHPGAVLLPPPLHGRGRRQRLHPPPRRVRPALTVASRSSAEQRATASRRRGRACASAGSTAGALSSTAAPSSSHRTAAFGPCQRNANDERRRRAGEQAVGLEVDARATPAGCRRGTAAPPRTHPALEGGDGAHTRRPRPAYRERRRPAAGDDAGEVLAGALLAGRGRAPSPRRRGRRRRPSPRERAIGVHRDGDARRGAASPSSPSRASSPARGGGRPGRRRIVRGAAERELGARAATRRAGGVGPTNRLARSANATQPRAVASASAPSPAATDPAPRSVVVEGDRDRRAVTDREHDRRRRQVDPLDRHVGRRPRREQVAAGERAGDRQRRVVADLDDRAPAAVGHRPHPLHGVAAGDPQAGLEHRRTGERGSGARRPRRPASASGRRRRRARRAAATRPTARRRPRPSRRPGTRRRARRSSRSSSRAARYGRRREPTVSP